MADLQSEFVPSANSHGKRGRRLRRSWQGCPLVLVNVATPWECAGKLYKSTRQYWGVRAHQMETSAGLALPVWRSPPPRSPVIYTASYNCLIWPRLADKILLTGWCMALAFLGELSSERELPATLRTSKLCSQAVEVLVWTIGDLANFQVV